MIRNTLSINEGCDRDRASTVRSDPDIRACDDPCHVDGNCFPWIEDMAQAQKTMDGLLDLSWPACLRSVARGLNPAHEEMFHRNPMD